LALVLTAAAIFADDAIRNEQDSLTKYGSDYGISSYTHSAFPGLLWAAVVVAILSVLLTFPARKDTQELSEDSEDDKTIVIDGEPVPARPRIRVRELHAIQEEGEEGDIELQDMAPRQQEDGDIELQDMAPARQEAGDIDLQDMSPDAHKDEYIELQGLPTHPAPVARDPSPEGSAGNRNARMRINRSITMYSRSSGASDLENAVSAREGV
jgi:hypothetical protein